MYCSSLAVGLDQCICEKSVLALETKVLYDLLWCLLRGSCGNQTLM